MPDQHIDVKPDAIRDGDTGNPILTKEQAERAREEWTAQHPPIPGLRWMISFNMYGEVSSRHLVVIPGWEYAFAPAVRVKPTSSREHDVATKASGVDRLGALAYQGWHAALPANVREVNTPWGSLPETFQEPLRQAAVLVWQHGENAGFHQALMRTLPSAQLGAAGELENVADQLLADHGHGAAPVKLHEVLAHIRSRVAALRVEAAETSQRARRTES